VIRRLTALLFCAAALAGAGCGTDDEQTASPASDGTATPAQDRDQPQDRGSYGY
jgi:hypothetical protein